MDGVLVMELSPFVYYVEGVKYQTTEDFIARVSIRGKRVERGFIFLFPNGDLVIQKGYAWDGASGPTIDGPESMRASLVHDALYDLIGSGHLSLEDRDEADADLHKLLIEDGMNPLRAKIWTEMVGMFGEAAALAGDDVKKAPLTSEERQAELSLFYPDDGE